MQSLSRWHPFQTIVIDKDQHISFAFSQRGPMGLKLLSPIQNAEIIAKVL